MVNWDILSELSYSCALGYLGVFIRYRLNYFLLFESPQPTNDLQITILRVFELQRFLLPNVIGCLVMGILVSWSRNILNFGGRKLFRDIHVGLATGFCGSLTTFSSWLATFNSALFENYWLLDIICLVLEFCITWSFFSFGEYIFEIGILLSRLRLRYQQPNSQTETSRGRLVTDSSTIETLMRRRSSESDEEVDIHNEENSRSLHVIPLTQKNVPKNILICERNHYEEIQNITIFVLVLISQIIMWTIISVDCTDSSVYNISDYSRDALRSVVLAPFGVSLRYILKRIESSTFSKPELNFFPWSTFLCNISGSCIAAGVIFYAPNWSWRRPFISGFLGAVTTVSSLIKEIKELYSSRGEKGPIYALVYAFVTFSISIMCIQFIRLHGS